MLLCRVRIPRHASGWRLFFSCIAVIPSSHTPVLLQSSRCRPVFAAKKFTLYRDGASKEQETAAAAVVLFFSLSPSCPLLLLLCLPSGRAGALFWCAGDNDQLDKATCGVWWARWRDAPFFLSSLSLRWQAGRGVSANFQRSLWLVYDRKLSKTDERLVVGCVHGSLLGCLFQGKRGRFHGLVVNQFLQIGSHDNYIFTIHQASTNKF